MDNIADRASQNSLIGHQSSLLCISLWNVKSYGSPINDIDFRSQEEQIGNFGLSLSYSLFIPCSELILITRYCVGKTNA